MSRVWYRFSRNELTSSSREDVDWTYGYDPIGNRTESAERDDANDPARTYVRNELNQYTQTRLRTDPEQYLTFVHDADGNLIRSWLAADMNCDGVVNTSDTNPFVLALTNPTQWQATYPGCNILNGDINGDGVTNWSDINLFVNLVGEGNGGPSQTYVWDAENRLVAVEPTAGTTIPEGVLRVRFSYDYRSRRIEKQVWTRSAGQWVLTAHRKYVWADWLLVAEVDYMQAVPGPEHTLRYTWGLDLGGLNGGGPSRDRQGAEMLQGAGGIGGLLAVEDPNDPNDASDLFGNFVFTYDANGNVGQLIDWAHDPNDPAGAIAAAYEYDPYGNVTAQSGAYADANPWRFSTKQFDSETGLLYFGLRYRDRERWINRDLIGERAGANLYAYVDNALPSAVDPLGMSSGDGTTQPSLPDVPTMPSLPDWVVNVSEEDKKKLNVSFTVTTACCKCTSIKWVQIVNESSHLWGALTSSGPSGWVLDLGPGSAGTDALKRNDIWYPHQVQFDSTDHGRCVRKSTLTDTPGGGFRYDYIKQDFESCAICINPIGDGKQRGCVLGCVHWGHLYDSGANPKHTWYGDRATPMGFPSQAMEAKLRTFQFFGGFEIANECQPGMCD